jgi:hypothetical protein
MDSPSRRRRERIRKALERPGRELRSGTPAPKHRPIQSRRPAEDGPATTDELGVLLVNLGSARDEVRADLARRELLSACRRSVDVAGGHVGLELHKLPWSLALYPGDSDAFLASCARADVPSPVEIVYRGGTAWSMGGPVAVPCWGVVVLGDPRNIGTLIDTIESRREADRG